MASARLKSVPWARPEPFWVRHPHVMGIATFVVLIALGLLLSGCECGKLWPCPGGL